MPLGAYYESILNTPQPIPDEKEEEPPQTSIPKQKEKEAAEEKTKKEEPPRKTTKKPSTRKTMPANPIQSVGISQPVPSPLPEPADLKARIIFGSRLAGPAERAERLAAIRTKSTLIAGVMVPPKPDEPDNCCMSGCVNCVWDRYREEMEGWSAANHEAQTRLRAQHGETASAMSMDDDGGGLERQLEVGPAKITKDLWDEELYRDLPVGIREFMKQEKRLKERHEKEGTLGG
jgi:hypothetical protein